MICAMENTNRERKIMKGPDKIQFKFTVNLEVPDPLQLQADIIDATPKPVIIVPSNDVFESMASDNATSSLVAMDHTTLNRKLEVDCLAWVPESLVNKNMLEIPNLHLITIFGEGSWAGMSVVDMKVFWYLRREKRATDLVEEMYDLILPYETANQLWGMPALWDVYAAYNGDGIKYFDKAASAKNLGECVPYLKQCDVRTVRVEVGGVDWGIYLSII